MRQEQLEQAVQVLIADGYRSISDHLPEVQSDATVMRHLTGLVKEGSPMVELHWHIAKQHPPNYDVDELWQRAQTVTINAIRYLTLAPEDLLLHLCVHASYQHQFAFDLRSLWDIRQVSNAARQCTRDVHPKCTNRVRPKGTRKRNSCCDNIIIEE